MVCVLDAGFSWDREEMKLGDSSLIVQGPEKQTSFPVRDCTCNYLRSWSQRATSQRWGITIKT